jgi:hypothetical protein
VLGLINAAPRIDRIGTSAAKIIHIPGKKFTFLVDGEADLHPVFAGMIIGNK